MFCHLSKPNRFLWPPQKGNHEAQKEQAAVTTTTQPNTLANTPNSRFKTLPNAPNTLRRTAKRRD